MKEGWKMKKLGEVYDVRDGTHDSPKYQSEGFPLITSKNLKNGVVTFDKVKYISEADYISINKRSKVDIGDVLFAMIGTIGNPTLIVSEPKYAIKNVALFKVDNFQNSQFLKYYLESPFTVDKMLNDAKGSTQRFVGLGYLRKFPIPIPPLSEQKQIVARLDAAFAKIEQAKVNLEKNIANARELFQSKLNEVFSQKGEGWEERSLGEVSSIKSKLVSPIEAQYQNLLHVGGGNIISKTGELVKLKTAKEEGLTSGKFYFNNSVVLYNKIRPYLIKVSKPDFNGLCSADMYPLTPNEDLISRDFLYYVLISKDFTDYAISGSDRAALPKVNRRHLFGYSFQLPTIEFQNKFISSLNKLKNETESIVKLYHSKINDLEELKKSLLQKAFAGELV